MHILFTGNTCFKLANFRSTLLASLITDGHRVTALAPLDRHSEALRNLGCAVVPLNLTRVGTSPLAEARLLAAFYANFRRLRPDVIFGFTIKNNIYGALAAKTLDIPFLPNVTGLGSAFDKKGLLQRVVMALYRGAFRRLPTVFLQNTEDRAFLVGSGVLRLQQVRLLPGSGVDLRRFAFKPMPSSSDSLSFLLHSRMLWGKGVGEFAEAARIVRRHHPTARFLLLGPIDHGHSAAVPLSVLHDWEAKGWVDYLGEVRDVRPYLRDADCIVLPSYYREGTPKSLLEAAAVGRPIVTTDTAGCRDAVEDGVTGFLCRPRDATSLASELMRIIEVGPTARTAMGCAGRQRAERMFDEALIVAAYREELKRLHQSSGKI